LIGNSTTGSDANISSIVPNGNGGSGNVGGIDRLYAYASVTPSGSATWDVYIIKNGSTTVAHCQITVSVNPCSDLVSSGTVVEGDTLSVQYTPTTSPAAAIISTGVRWIPITANEYPVFSLQGVLPQQTANRYFDFVGQGTTGSATEGGYNVLVPPVTQINLYGMQATLSAVPNGYTRTFRMHYGTTYNSQSDGAVQCTITSAVKTCTSPAPTTNQVVTGSSVGTPQFMNWYDMCSSASCAATTYGKVSAIVVTTP
jgi:hypothetical protein